MRYYNFDINQPIKIEFLGKEHLIPPRLHISRRLNTYIMYVVTDGQLTLRNDQQELSLRTGDVCIFETGELQIPVSSTDCEYYYVHFDGRSVTPVEGTPESYLLYVQQQRENVVNASPYGFDRFQFFSASVMKITHIADRALFLHFTSVLEKCKIPAGDGSIRRRFHAASMLMELFFGTGIVHLREDTWARTFCI